MRLNSKFTGGFHSGLTGAALSVLCGLVLWAFPAHHGLVRLSYDLPFFFSPEVKLDKLLIITMDERSYRKLGQNYPDKFDRAQHALLLDKLKEARMVVFDVFFSDPGLAESNEALDRALKAHGRVVLAGDPTGLEPLEIIRKAVSTNWGLAGVSRESDIGVRLLYPGTKDEPSLAWAAAALAQAPITRSPGKRMDERWIRHYGPHGTIESISYYSALKEKEPVFFRDRFVFVGGKPDILLVGEKADECRTPYTRFGGSFSSGVEVMATSFLNLNNGEWLTKLQDSREFLVLILCGLIFGYGLTLVAPITAAGFALLGSLCISIAAIALVWQTHVWFSWMVLIGGQVPTALAWSVLAYSRTLRREKERLEKELLESKASAAAREKPPRADEGIPAEASDLMEKATELDLRSVGPPSVPLIADHTILRRVGEGAYGEVWIAQNTIGLYHAVKIARQREFKEPEPYEREFRGICKFMPISLNHPGLLHILHVGRNDQQGYFYCIMELGDDEVSGQKIDPLTYSPKNLSKELKKRGRFSVCECLQLFLPITEALEYLHRQKLIHRDIKPSNIIFVDGVPKLADIGLVTQIDAANADMSYVGTPGYIAPEGPGTVGADIFSLGMVIYEVSSGLHRKQFPQWPTSLREGEEFAGCSQFNRIILKACETNPRQRYQSAAELHLDLQCLKTTYSPAKA